jgi:hypothetical protein
MLPRLAALLLFLFLALNAVAWPVLPYHAHLADLLFPLLAAAIVMLPGAGLSWQRADLAVAAYLIGALPALMISPDRRQSAIELLRECYVAIIYVVFALAARRGLARRIGGGLAIGGGLLSIAGLLVIAAERIGAVSWPLVGEVMTLPYLGDTVRLRALTDTEAMFACVLTASIPFAIERWQSDRARAWGALAAVMTIAALFTFSHAIAGVAVAMLIAAWRSLRPRRAVRLLAVAAVVLIVVAFNFAATVAIRSVSTGGSGYVDPSQYQYGVDDKEMRIGASIVKYTVMSYARLKQVAWDAFTDAPIAGLGLDQFPAATTRAYHAGRLPSNYIVTDPHSTVLGRMAECGIIGALTLLLLWIAWAKMAGAAMRAAPGIGYAAAAALFGLFVSSLNADIMNFRFLWVVAGLLRGLHEADGIITPDRTRRPL